MPERPKTDYVQLEIKLGNGGQGEGDEWHKRGENPLLYFPEIQIENSSGGHSGGALPEKNFVLGAFCVIVPPLVFFFFLSFFSFRLKGKTNILIPIEFLMEQFRPGSRKIAF